MKKLSDEQRTHLEKLVKSTKDVNERNRVCVILGRDDGHTPSEIAAILRISESSVYDYQREYDCKQKTINDRHTGRACKLTAQQEDELKGHISATTYLKVRSVAGWILKNEVKTLGTTARQERLHFIGAIELSEMQVITKEYSTVNAVNMADFLRTLSESVNATKVHLILDNGSSNKNEEVQKFLESQTKIQIHYLPPYSPNLNAIERLWKVMREYTTYNRIYPRFSDFTEKIRDFFATGVGNLKEVLKKRINDNFQKVVINPVQTSTF